MTRHPVRRLFALIGALFFLLAAAGCSANDSASEAPAQLDKSSLSGAAAGSDVDPDAIERMDREAAEAGAKPAIGEGTNPEITPVENQQVIVTGSVDLAVDDASQVAAKVIALTEKAGGHIDSRNESGSGASSEVTLVLRLPADATESTLAEIRKLGKLLTSQSSTEDVTTQTIDLDQRISALKASVDRLETMIRNSENTKDLLSVESMLTERQAELQSLTSQRTYLADQVRYSTITVTLSPKTTAPPAQSRGIGDSFATGWNNFVSFLSSLANGLALAAPFLGLVIVVVLVLVVAIRRHRARHPHVAAPGVPALPRDPGAEAANKAE